MDIPLDQGGELKKGFQKKMEKRKKEKNHPLCLLHWKEADVLVSFIPTPCSGDWLSPITLLELPQFKTGLLEIFANDLHAKVFTGKMC